MPKNKNSQNESLFKDPSTRLRFSIWVIIANFILGIIGMLVGTDLTALGVFLALSNSPLYVYVLGRSFRPSQIPDQYYNQPHTGSGGLGDILNKDNDDYNNQWDNDYNEYIDRTPINDGYNIPTSVAEKTDRPKSPKTVKKDPDEIG